MESIPLKELGLESRWPELARLQEDLAKFQRRQQEAAARATTLEQQLPAMRARDIQAEVEALRKERKRPEPRHEPRAREELEAAERERDVAARVVQSLHEEIGAFMAEHQPAVYQDVLAARDDIGRQVAEHARAALAAYSRFEDLGRTLKQVRPAEPVPEDMPARRLTNAFAGVIGTQSVGPARGEVEAMLAYLMGLAPAEESESDVA